MRTDLQDSALMQTTHLDKEEVLRQQRWFKLGEKLPFSELWMEGETNPFAGIYEQ